MRDREGHSVEAQFVKVVVLTASIVEQQIVEGHRTVIVPNRSVLNAGSELSVLSVEVLGGCITC